MVRSISLLVAAAAACGAPSTEPQHVAVAQAPSASSASAPVSPAPAPPLTVAAQRPAAPASTVRPSTIAKPAAGLLERRVPFQSWPTLGARTIGLLVVNQSEWGPAVLWTRALRATKQSEGPGDRCYLFFGEGKSAQALYFPSQDGHDGKNFLKGWSVPLAAGVRSTPMDVAMMCPSIPNRHRLDGSAHLVRLEVNGGRGAPPNVHFVATRVEILDGTTEYPIVAAKALAEARDRFDRLLEQQSPRIQEILAQPSQPPAKEAHPDSAMVESPVDRVAEGLFPAWDDAKKELSVLFFRRSSRTTRYRYKTTITPQCPRGAPCMPPREGWQEHEAGTHADIGYSVVFDKNGQSVSEEAFASP